MASSTLTVTATIQLGFRRECTKRCPLCHYAQNMPHVPMGEATSTPVSLAAPFL